jgi:hypothetical protein
MSQDDQERDIIGEAPDGTEAMFDYDEYRCFPEAWFNLDAEKADEP